MDGCLLDFIRSRRKTFTKNWTKNSDNKTLNLLDLTRMSFQVANGMSFLEDKKV